MRQVFHLMALTGRLNCERRSIWHASKTIYYPTSISNDAQRGERNIFSRDESSFVQFSIIIIIITTRYVINVYLYWLYETCICNKYK